MWPTIAPFLSELLEAFLGLKFGRTEKQSTIFELYGQISSQKFQLKVERREQKLGEIYKKMTPEVYQVFLSNWTLLQGLCKVVLINISKQRKWRYVIYERPLGLLRILGRQTLSVYTTLGPSLWICLKSVRLLNNFS